MAPGANKKVANGLVTLSSAAIVAVYAAGFMRTKAAAEKMDEASNGRRPSMPAPPTAGERRTPEPIEPATNPAQPTDMRSPVMPKPEATTAAAGAPTSAPAAKTNTAAPTSASAPTTTTTATTTAAAAPNAPSLTNPTNQKGSPEQNPTNATNLTNPTNLAVPVGEEKKAEAKTDAPSNLLMPKEKYKDGTYLGWGTCRHGDIQAQVVITDGRITSASIAQCWTRYSCSWVSHLPGQVVARQSPDVDYVTGATQSANAFYWAIIDALTKAKTSSRPGDTK